MRRTLVFLIGVVSLANVLWPRSQAWWHGAARARVLPSGFEAVRGDLAQGYSGAWFARADALLSATIQPSNRSTVEGACFAMMRGRETVRSTDMLDFFVVHLSWLERRLALTKPSSSEASASVLTLAVRDDLQAILERHARTLRDQAREAAPSRAPRILAVLPFFAAGGRGDSSRYSSYALRRAALSATFWSVRAALSAHVVVAVCSEVDAQFARDALELHDDDVLRACEPGASEDNAEPLAAPALALAALAMIQARLRSSRGGAPRMPHAPRRAPMETAAQFEYVYYSEADQILHVRGHAQLLAAASNVTANSAPVVIPHRATPLPLPRDLSPATLSRIGMGAESAVATDAEDATIASVIRRELRQNTAKQLHQAPRSSPPAGARCCWRSRRARTEYQDARVHLLAETSREGGRELPLGFAFALAEGDYWHARRTCHYAISEAGCDGSPAVET